MHENMYTIVTGRYDNATWEATCRYRTKKNIQCIYAPAVKISPTIDIDSPVFVIEMNNSINQIMGIGLVRNSLVTDKYHKVQEDTNCNRYIYIGEYHISRETLIEYNKNLVEILDEILFKGYTHSKRGCGLTRIPEKVMKLEICADMNIKKEIRNIFVKHFRKPS